MAVQAGVREPQRLFSAHPSLLAKVRSLALLHQRFGLPHLCPEAHAEHFSLNATRKRTYPIYLMNPMNPMYAMHLTTFESKSTVNYVVYVFSINCFVSSHFYFVIQSITVTTAS